MIKGILWDVGGTILYPNYRTETDYLKTILIKYGVNIEALSLSDFINMINKMRNNYFNVNTLEDEEKNYRMIFKTYFPKIKNEMLENIIDEIMIGYDQFCIPNEIKQLIKDLKKLELEQVVISNWPPSLSKMLQAHGLSDYFDYILSSGILGIKKPNLKIFEFALDKMNLDASEVIMIGNSYDFDINPAKSINIKTIKFSVKKDSISKLKTDIFQLLEENNV